MSSATLEVSFRDKSDCGHYSLRAWAQVDTALFSWFKKIGQPRFSSAGWCNGPSPRGSCQRAWDHWLHLSTQSLNFGFFQTLPNNSVGPQSFGAPSFWKSMLALHFWRCASWWWGQERGCSSLKTTLGSHFMKRKDSEGEENSGTGIIEHHPGTKIDVIATDCKIFQRYSVTSVSQCPKFIWQGQSAGFQHHL